MKVLFIPYGTQNAPATRYRVTQYLAYLKERKIDYFVFSAISKFSTTLMIKSPDFKPFTRFLYYMYVSIERLFRLAAVTVVTGGFDIIFLQRTTFPCRLELLLKKINKNIVFDIDDAIYLPDKQGNDIATRVKKYIKEKEVINMLKVCKAVIVENEYIKKFVAQHCKDVIKIPGPIDTERFFVKSKPRSGVTVGWIGSPATTPYLHMLDNVFKAIKDKHSSVKFRFIGLGRYFNRNIRFEKIVWNYKTEVGNLQLFDIGIMPMPNNEWTKGKLGCKMLQYMAVGVPAVISYTPTNAEVIKNGENGFFARTDKEWIDILSKLIENGELRKIIGKKGRETVEKEFSLNSNVSVLIDVFKRLQND